MNKIRISIKVLSVLLIILFYNCGGSESSKTEADVEKTGSTELSEEKAEGSVTYKKPSSSNAKRRKPSSKSRSYPSEALESSPPSSYDERSDKSVASREYNEDYVAGSRAGYTGSKPKTSVDTNAYYGSEYIAGGGHYDRIKKMIAEGVVIDGKKIKLTTFQQQYDQDFPPPVNKSINMIASTDKTRYMEDEEIFFQIGLKGINRKKFKRPPLNICLVLDRSGSMEEENKMEYAKKAAKQLVRSMRDGDYFSCVIYDDLVETLIPSTRLNSSSKRQILSSIKSIEPRGGTNIYDGLSKGYNECRKHLTNNNISQVMLISDGLANEGVTDENAFKRLTQKIFKNDEIQTTTIGVGLEFNDSLMLNIASAGYGNYHFIEKPSRIETILNSELNSLNRIIARAIRIRFKVNDDFFNIHRIYGFRKLSDAEIKDVKDIEQSIDIKSQQKYGIQTDRDIVDEDGIKMFFPNFTKNQEMVILMKASLKRYGVRNISLGTVHIKYKDYFYNKNQSEEIDVKVNITKSESTQKRKYTIVKNILGFEIGEALQDASTLIAQNSAINALQRLNEVNDEINMLLRRKRDRELLEDQALLKTYIKVLTKIKGDTNIAYTPVGKYLIKTLSFEGYKRAVLR